MKDHVAEKKKQELVGGSRDFLTSFAIAVNPKYRTPWHIEVIAQRLEAALDKAMRNEKARIILELPPRHGKSELASVTFPAWVLGKYPDVPIIDTSYSADLATTFGLKTRDLMNSPEYQSIFPTRLRSDQKAKGKWLTDKGGGYTAAGVGGGILGRGFKVGIIDDPYKNREEAESEVIREKVWDWYESTFYTRQEGNGAIIVIMQRWHVDDLVGRLLKKQKEDEAAGVEEYDKWDLISFPAIAEEAETFRKQGEALWPERFSLQNLRNIQNTLSIYNWSALYQQRPITAESQEFMEEWFKPYDERILTGKVLENKTLVDLAVSKNKEANNSVVRTVSKEKTGPNWYLREESAGKMDPLQVIDAIFYHFETYRSEVYIEGVGYQRALEYFLKEEMKKRQTYFNVHILKRNTSTSKEERIRGLIPLAKTGVIHRRDTGEDAALVREAIAFPNGELDDRIDCLANGLEAFQPTQYNKPRKARRYHQPASDVIGG